MLSMRSFFTTEMKTNETNLLSINHTLVLGRSKDCLQTPKIIINRLFACDKMNVKQIVTMIFQTKHNCKLYALEFYCKCTLNFFPTPPFSI